MTRFYKKRAQTPGLNLLRFLIQQGGVATLEAIAHRANDGRLLARAKPELEGLICVEKGHQPRSGRAVTRVFLTPKGWAACAQLQPGWEPRRLATEILKAWFYELQAEGDPWALSFQKDSDAATHCRTLTARGEKHRPPIHPRKSKKGIQPKGGFLAGHPAGTKMIDGKPTPTILDKNRIPPRTDVAAPAIAPQRRPESSRHFMPKEVCSFCAGFPKSEVQPHDCNLYMVPVDCAHWLRTGQTVRTRQGNAPDPRVAIIARANVAGYPTRAGREVMIESKWVSAEEWNRLVPEN